MAIERGKERERERQTERDGLRDMRERERERVCGLERRESAGTRREGVEAKSILLTNPGLVAKF